MKLIEFLGMPRAGKTTQIDRLKIHLEQRGLKVAVVTDRERAERIHVRPIGSLAYIMTFFSMALDEYHKHLPGWDVLLIDRGFNDAQVWADVRQRLNTITAEECTAFKTCFAKFAKLSAASLYFDISVKDSLLRHESSGVRQDVDAVAMNKQWLTAIRQSYQKHAPSFHNLIHINGNRTPEEIEKDIHGHIKLIFS